MKSVILCSFCIIMNFLALHCKGQELHIQTGLLITEQSSGTRIIDMDSLSFSENNRYNSLRLIPGISFNYFISPTFKIGVGVQYRRSRISTSVSKKIDDPIGYVSKGTIIGLPTWEFPLTLYGSIKRISKGRIYLFAGIMPVVNKINYKADYLPKPNSIDWSQGVVDALNASHTIAKSHYFNYHFGISIEHRRFGFDILVHKNLSNNLANPYELYNHKFTFLRKTQSLRLNIKYIIELKKEKVYSH